MTDEELNKTKKELEDMYKASMALQREIEVLRDHQECEVIPIPTIKDLKDELKNYRKKLVDIQLYLKQFKTEIWQDCLDISTGKYEEIKKEISDRVIFRIFGLALIRIKK